MRLDHRQPVDPVQVDHPSNVTNEAAHLTGLETRVRRCRQCRRLVLVAALTFDQREEGTVEIAQP
jgi:hypothetical protein